jgi:inner membrane protein
VGATVGRVFSTVPARVTRKYCLLAALIAMLPDIDVVGFWFGVPYFSFWGHRGITHSLAFAAVSGFGAAWLTLGKPGWHDRRWWRGYLCLAACAASHPLLDAMTNGGRGIALLSPFQNGRFFFSFRPIEVSPLGVSGFLGWRGAQVLASEALWLGLPCALLLSGAHAWKVFRQRRSS